MKRYMHIALASLIAVVWVMAEEPPQTELVAIPGATFKCGTPITKKRDKEFHEDESPVTVAVAPFLIGRFPVTAGEFSQFLNSVDTNKHPAATLYNHEDFIAVGSGERLKYSTIVFADGKFQPRAGADKAPANLVTWKGAVLYCKWLTEETGETYRLPSEAEWELAASGPARRPWPWGTAEPAASHGVRYDYSTLKHHCPTNAVGSYPANATPDGVLDLLGFRMGEWCAGKYMASPRGDDLLDTRMDLSDLETPRAVRGVWTKMDSRDTTPKILQLIGFWESPRGSHLGRPWTRSKAHPITAVTRIAAYGFRVVREKETKDREAQQGKSSVRGKPRR